MVTPGPASIVIIPFPFSDLSATKLRPAVVLADTSQGDWLLCQITSNPYSDSQAIEITKSDLKKGALNAVSFVRPMKLFTANETLMLKRVAILKEALTLSPSPKAREGSWFPLPGERDRVRGCIATLTGPY